MPETPIFGRPVGRLKPTGRFLSYPTRPIFLRGRQNLDETPRRGVRIQGQHFQRICRAGQGNGRGKRPNHHCPGAIVGPEPADDIRRNGIGGNPNEELRFRNRRAGRVNVSGIDRERFCGIAREVAFGRDQVGQRRGR